MRNSNGAQLSWRAESGSSAAGFPDQGKLGECCLTVASAVGHDQNLMPIAPKVRSSALCKALHKADYAKYPIMESSRRTLGQVVGGERIGSV